MVAMSVPQMGRAGKVASSGEGRDRSSVPTVGQTQSALSGSQLFSSFLHEYERQAQLENDRMQSRVWQKGRQSASVKQASQSRDTSLRGSVSGGTASQKRNDATTIVARNGLSIKKASERQQKRSEDTSSSADDASQHEKNVRYNAAQNQQDWLLQQMLAFSSLASGQQLPSQGLQQDGSSVLLRDSQDLQAVRSGEGAAVSASDGRDQGKEANGLDVLGAPVSEPLDGNVHGALSSKEKPLTRLASTDEALHITETGTAQLFSQQSLPQGTEQNGQNAQQRMDASAPSMLRGDMSQLPTQQAGVQISHVSVTAAGEPTSSQGGAQEAASHMQEMRVDSAAYLNAKESAFYNTPPSQVVSAAEQQGVRQVSNASKASFMDGPDRSVVGGLGASAVDTQHAGSSAVQITQDDSGSMGQEQQNDQESASASGNESQKSTLNVSGTSASMGPTSFQGLVNGSNTATHIEAHSLPKEDNRMAYQPNEAELDVDYSGHAASSLAQKRLSDPSSRLEMTVKTSDSTSVRVQVTRLPEGVAAVSLQGADDATTKALTKSRHELLEQLHAAGIHATSVKIDVLPADLNGINNDHAQDQLGQNASSGGQHGQGGDRSYEGQNQGHDVSEAVMSSTDEGDAARRGAESIIGNLNTPQAVTGSGLNISV